ncbi:M91 family zinc metallopeptidase [Cystobacter ferrugineus]|uniref:M91 family zinc metallopeptidase n=1 Tax=Cystobacter ferrugineus TaxID=83449 RepID=UPI001161157C|nr:M91 family zinc metallopeptidase [Cystobacter ferrugineus]
MAPISSRPPSPAPVRTALPGPTTSRPPSPTASPAPTPTGPAAPPPTRTASPAPSTSAPAPTGRTPPPPLPPSVTQQEFPNNAQKQEATAHLNTIKQNLGQPNLHVGPTTTYSVQGGKEQYHATQVGQIKIVDQNADLKFTNGVLKDLSMISSKPSGKAMLNSINSYDGTNGKTAQNVAVYHREGLGNSTDKASESPGLQMHKGARVDINGKPGLGLSPEEAKKESSLKPKYGAFNSDANKPSHVTLMHELVHADDIVRGINNANDIQLGKNKAMKVNEARATGVSKFRDNDYMEGKTSQPQIYSENTYRKECGLPERPFYSSSAEIKVSGFMGFPSSGPPKVVDPKGHMDNYLNNLQTK